MKFRVRVTDRAMRAIDDHVSYIAHEKQEPVNASRVLGAIERAIDTLETMPHRCPKAPEDAFVDDTIRMLIVKMTLLLLYRVDESAKEVTIIGFRHGSQSPLELE